MEKNHTHITSYKGQEVYVCFKQVEKVPVKKVYLSDVGELYCADTKILAGCRSIFLYHFQGKREKKGFSILEIVALIQKKYPDITVNSFGKPDFLLEYTGNHNTSKTVTFLKTLLVSLIAFAGSAFAIMSFNNDGDVKTIFSMVYQQFTGYAPKGVTSLEAGYSLGLPLGIMFFFNHAEKKKDCTDPTPLEVQLRLYGDDVAGSVIQKEKLLEQDKSTEHWNET